MCSETALSHQRIAFLGVRPKVILWILLILDMSCHFYYLLKFGFRLRTSRACHQDGYHFPLFDLRFQKWGSDVNKCEGGQFIWRGYSTPWNPIPTNWRWDRWMIKIWAYIFSETGSYMFLWHGTTWAMKGLYECEGDLWTQSRRENLRYVYGMY